MKEVWLAVVGVTLVAWLGFGCTAESSTTPPAKKGGTGSLPTMIVEIHTPYFEYGAVLKTKADYQAALVVLEGKGAELLKQLRAQPGNEDLQALYLKLLVIINAIKDILQSAGSVAPQGP